MLLSLVLDINLDIKIVYGKHPLYKDLILPEGANSSNHRWDQTLLTLIYYRDYEALFVKDLFCFGIKVHQDKDWLDFIYELYFTTRNYK